MAYDAKSAEKTVTINEEAGLGPEWTPVDAPPIIPGRSPNADTSSDGNSRFLQGSLPPGFQHDTSFVGTAYKGATTPQLSLMPLGINGSPASNAAISSTSTKVASALIAAIPPAPVATGADIDDGLVHGDAIWETDSAYVMFRDEFISSPSASPLGGNSLISTLNWKLSANTGAFAAASHNQGGLSPLHIGEFCWTNSTTNNSTATSGIGNIAIPPSSTTPNMNTIAWALLGNPSWKATFIWRFHRDLDGGGFSVGPNFLTKSVYIGFANNITIPSSGWSRPPIFMGVRYDTDATAPAISDSTMQFEAVQNALPNASTITRNNIQGTVVDTTITPKEDVYYRLDMTCTTAGQIVMSLNGVSTTTFTIPKIVINAGDAGSDSVTSKNGQAGLVFGTTGGSAVNHPFGPGAPITVAGFTAGNLALNGSFICNQSPGIVGSDDRLDYPLAGTIVNNGPGGWSVTGYASLIPIFMFGNDSTVGPPVADTRICIDYFSFIWNPGVGGGTGTPDPTKPRYF